MFLLIFFIKMYAHNKNICLKFKNTCFAKFHSRKITSQVIIFATRFAKCEARIPTHGSQDFCRITNSVLNKSKAAIPALFNSPEVLSSASDKPKLFAKNFSKNSNLEDLGIPLSIFPKGINLKLHNIPVTAKMVKKVIMNLDPSKVSAPDCVPVVVLKNCEPELSYILAKLFSMCVKESCFLVLLKDLIRGPSI